jgi:hypothetical protein
MTHCLYNLKMNSGRIESENVENTTEGGLFMNFDIRLDGARDWNKLGTEKPFSPMTPLMR